MAGPVGKEEPVVEEEVEVEEKNPSFLLAKVGTKVERAQKESTKQVPGASTDKEADKAQPKEYFGNEASEHKETQQVCGPSLLLANAGKTGAESDVEGESQSPAVEKCTLHTGINTPQDSTSQYADSSEGNTSRASSEGTQSEDPQVKSLKGFEDLDEPCKRSIQNVIIQAAYNYKSLNNAQAQSLRQSVQDWQFLWQYEGNKGLSPKTLEQIVKNKIEGRSGYKRPVCWYNQRGFCRRGAKCNYVHNDHS